MIQPKKNILYLYREIMPYNIPVLKVLAASGYNVVVIHDTVKRQTPYEPPFMEGVTFYSKDTINQFQLNALAIELSPSLVYVADRTNPKYNKTATLLRRQYGTPVIIACDTQWRGGRQWLNVLTSFFRHKIYYSHILVAGLRQFEYAKRLGFNNNKVLWPMNSADVELFKKVPICREKFDLPRNLLFVGRFAEAKGIRTLLKAWEKIGDKKGATLTLVGNGPLKDTLVFPADVNVMGFKSQAELIEIASKTSCFILPSVFEPWALVLHEFAAAGLPLIATSACGASHQFVINNYNGFMVEPNDVEDLIRSIKKIIDMDSERLFQFATNSKSLSNAITPELVGSAILSVLS
jgi:glycosyltransferase involved in cell wall biosynthesis